MNWPKLDLLPKSLYICINISNPSSNTFRLSKCTVKGGQRDSYPRFLTKRTLICRIVSLLDYKKPIAQRGLH